MSEASVETVQHGSISWKCLPGVQLKLGQPVQDFKQYLLPVLDEKWATRQLDSKVFDAGITNALYAIFDSEKGLKDSGDDVVLVRLNGNGTDEIISRTDELISMVTLHNSGLSPPAYAQCKNGLCYGFLPGRHLSPMEFTDSKFMRLNARVLARFHSVAVPTAFQDRPPLVWFKCDQWIKTAPHKFDDPVKQKLADGKEVFPIRKQRPGNETRQLMSCPFEEGVGSIAALSQELMELKEVLSQSKSPIVFCHNDLLCGNFIYNTDKDITSLIDFEYAGPNYLAYDIANHFCEFAGIDSVDYDLYPCESMQREWLTYYLQESAVLKGQDPATAAREDAITALYCEVNRFALGAHLFWTVWALIQAVHSAIDFNYAEYSGMRFAEYKKRKHEFLSL